MKRFILQGMVLGGMLGWTVLPDACWAQEEGNRYTSIVARNAFGLKDPPPPPPPPEPPAPPAPPSPDIKLTGITSLFNQNKALLEITKKGPDAPDKPLKLIINEGETSEGVKVVSIDMARNEVAVQIGDLLTNVTFTVASSKPKAPPGRPTIPGRRGTPSARRTLPGARATTSSAAKSGSGGPVVINSRRNNAARGVTVLGGAESSSPAPQPAARSTVPSYNASSAAAARARAARQRSSTQNNSSANNRLRTIPTRTIRTDAPAPAPMSRDEAYLLIEAQRELQRSGAANVPNFPMPPTPYSSPSEPQQDQ